MDKTMRSDLCRGLRACGIPQKETHTILNTLSKWIDANGIEWTNDRIKALRQWYETCLAGSPTPPSWFKHNKDGYPTDIWNWVFSLKPAKALGVLSVNTVFYNERVTDAQRKKFLHALEGTSIESQHSISSIIEDNRRKPFRLKIDRMPSLRSPTVFDMNKNVPILDNHSTLKPRDRLPQAAQALEASWKSLPKVTYDFLDRMDCLDYMPWQLLFDKFGFYTKPHLSETVGRVSAIQQAELKARVVGNPNRITEVTLEPLQDILKMAVRRFPTDVTFAQEDGILWVQTKLQQGVTLAGSDLTSASDLLDVKSCFDLVESVVDLNSITGYSDFRDYYLQVCKSPWYCTFLEENVSWKHGSVLGTGPSFFLLTLTNSCAAIMAYRHLESLQGDLGYPLRDAFRVLGDDIVMRSELEPYYTRVIEALGGEINHTKTLTSNKVAEFAGHVITPDNDFLKRIRFKEPSDRSFLAAMSQLGDQAKYFLKPRQRKVYEFTRYIPGYVVDGPYMRDSYGVSLAERYGWYLECVKPVLERARPDLDQELYDMTLLKACLSAQVQGLPVERDWLVPSLDAGYLPTLVTPQFKIGGDPRLIDGKTTLEVWDEILTSGLITPFEEWQISHKSDPIWSKIQQTLTKSEGDCYDYSVQNENPELER